MALTLLDWLLIACPITISTLLVFWLRSRDLRSRQLDPETGKALLSRLRSSSWEFGRGLRGAPGTLIAAAAAFLLVAGIGVATSYFGERSEASGSGDAISISPPRSRPDGEMLGRLEDYTRSIGTEKHASTTPAGKLLPDVNTMIERLAARLESTPDDIKGWRMLGWSYFQTGRYEEAATAYAKAVALDPSSAEVKLSYEQAKAKASEAAPPSRTGAVDKGGDGPSVEKNAKSEALPPREYDAAIRAMVDGLADRLKSSPGDVDGWTRLMRSRVVLGEKEAAATAFREALEVFKDNSAATGKITAAAIDLGLKAE